MRSYVTKNNNNEKLILSYKSIVLFILEHFIINIVSSEMKYKQTRYSWNVDESGLNF